MLLNNKAALLVALLAAILFFAHGSNIMTPNLTPLTMSASISGSWYDVYANKTAGVFILLTSGNIYNLDYATRQNVLASQPVSQLSNYGELYAALAQSDGFVYVATFYNLWRFDIYNVSNNPVAYPSNFSDQYQMAIDTTTKYGYMVDQSDSYVDVVNLLTMKRVTTFKYTYTFPNYPLYQTGTPGGWAIAVDSSRSLLYIGVVCDSPTPSYIWQFDIRDPLNVNLTNKIIHSANACFERGFVEVGDGRAWFYEDDAAWNGGFDSSDLSWGSDATVPTAEYVEAVENVEQEHMSFWIDEGSSPYQGRIYRVCNLEDQSQRVHEIVTWAPKNDYSNIRNSYFDSTSRTLYVMSTSNFVVTTDVGATDCQQVPSTPPSCPSPASRLTPFAWF